MKKSIIVYIILLLIINCSNNEKTYTVEIKSGVKHIHNLAPLWGNEPKLKLEFVQKIGVLEGEENYMIYMPFDVAVDDEENIFIFDRRRPAIRKYTSDGIFVKDIGQKGAGPGEIGSSLCMDVDDEFNLYLTDMSNSRINIFSSEGEYKDVINISKFFHYFCVLSDSRIMAFDVSLEVNPPKLMRLLDAGTNQIRLFGDPQLYDDPMMMYLANRCDIENDNEDNLYITFQHENRIEKYSPDGDLLMRIDRPLFFDVEHQIKISKFYDASGAEMEKTDPELTYVSIDIGIDHKKRIWVTTFNDQPKDTENVIGIYEEHTLRDFEIFTSEGVLLGKIPIKAPLYFFRIFGDRMFFIDPHKEVCVREFRIVEIE
jgi:hypothetical protein